MGGLTDEHPLGELVRLEILIEEGGILDLGEAVGLFGHGVVQNLRARGGQSGNHRWRSLPTCACERSRWHQSSG